jgi:hypothetical protein
MRGVFEDELNIWFGKVRSMRRVGDITSKHITIFVL